MNNQQAYQKYRHTQISTANPGKLVLMLYQGGIKFLNLAKKSIQDNNIEDTNNYIVRVQNIVLELMDTLDMDKGGQISQNLYNLYEYMNHRLVQANIKKDVEIIEEVSELLKDLKDTWKEILDSNAQQSNQTNISIEG